MGLIQDARVLRAGFVPREVKHRDSEINHLSRVMEPITDGRPADTALVTGPSGTGKTCIAKFVTERLREEILDVQSVYVNCWRQYTRFRMLYQVLEALGETVDVHRQSTPHDELLTRLEQYDGPRAVVILDEVDQLENPDVLYDLYSLPQFSLICIANDEEALLGTVDDRVRSRLRSAAHIRMDRYHPDQLTDILQARADRALASDAITAQQLARIADAAAGDARLAIGILRSAAALTEENGADSVGEDMLEEAGKQARTNIRQANIDTLTPHQRAVYDVVDEHGPLSPNAIYDRYVDAVDDPRTDRSVRGYLTKMVQYNVLTAEGSSHDRVYDTIE